MMGLSGDFLQGSYPPVITPFRNDKVDFDVYERLVARQIDGGSQGIVVNGTSGEPSTLSIDERNELVRIAISTAQHRVPVVAATGSQSIDDSKQLTDFAINAGADAVLIVTPYYSRPPQRGLVEYFVEICGRSEVPVLMYHIPGRAAVNVTIPTLEQIAERAENFVGMKHAATDLDLVSDAIAALGPDFRIFCGLEELSFPMLALGACGLMNAVGNIVPDRVAGLWRAARDGDLSRARAIHYELLDLNRSIFFDTNPIPLKYMLRRVGLLEKNEHRLPMMRATAELENRLDQVLKAAGLL